MYANPASPYFERASMKCYPVWRGLEEWYGVSWPVVNPDVWGEPVLRNVCHTDELPTSDKDAVQVIGSFTYTN